MTTYIGTGRDLTITVGGQALSPQASSVTLTYENQVEKYQTLTGITKKVVSTDGKLSVSMFQDTTAVSSFTEALWTAAETGTAVAFTLLVGGTNGTSFAGNVIPQFPTIGGSADAALESSIDFEITGTVTMDTTP